MHAIKLCAVGALFQLVVTTAQAQQPATLTLACKGTIENVGVDKTPISMGIIVNFTDRTVQGFSDPGLLDIPVKIKAANDVTVSFGGSITGPFAQYVETSISGTLDRVTG